MWYNKQETAWKAQAGMRFEDNMRMFDYRRPSAVRYKRFMNFPLKTWVSRAGKEAS
jgi:hypothetical protein